MRATGQRSFSDFSDGVAQYFLQSIGETQTGRNMVLDNIHFMMSAIKCLQQSQRRINTCIFRSKDCSESDNVI